MSARDELGKWGEELIAQWIPTKGGKILAQRWHCVLGEVDIIALNRTEDLIFIEVKTRSPRNIDQDGILSVSQSKQMKLWKTAQMFLLKHPQHHDRNCRFDIALVQWEPLSVLKDHPTFKNKRPKRFTRTFAEHEFTLVNYLVHAFEQPKKL